MRIFKIITITGLFVAIVSGTINARPLRPGEQSIDRLLLPRVSRVDKRRAGWLHEAAYLYVSTDPKWADIFINGRRAGKGTAMLTRTKGSPFVRIRIKATDRETISGWLRLEPKKVIKIRAKLSRKGGNLTLLTSPAGAKVTVDGIDSGDTPVTVSALAPGPHTVELHSGEWQWKARLAIKAGKTNVISMKIPEMMAAPVAKPAPAVQSKPGQPAPQQPEPAKAPENEPKPVAKTALEKEKKVDLAGKKPNCKKICGHYAVASGASRTVQEMLKPGCMKRCNAMDMDFSICAWKAKSMADVRKCADLPEKK